MTSPVPPQMPTSPWRSMAHSYRAVWQSPEIPYTAKGAFLAIRALAAVGTLMLAIGLGVFMALIIQTMMLLAR